jgi:hypothetical protein
VQLEASKLPEPEDEKEPTTPVGESPTTVAVHVDGVPTITGDVQETAVKVGSGSTVIGLETPTLARKLLAPS